MEIQSASTQKSFWFLVLKKIGYVAAMLWAFLLIIIMLPITIPAGLAGILWYLVKRSFFIGYGLMLKSEK